MNVDLSGSYEKNGVKSVYPWQRECLFQSNALDGNNLVNEIDSMFINHVITFNAPK